MPVLHRLVARLDSSANKSLTPTMINLLITLVVIVLVGILLIAVLFFLRSQRNRKQQQQQCSQQSLQSDSNPKISSHRRLTITAAPYGRRSESVYVYNEKQGLINEMSTPPQSPVPEIHITFPEEQDETGKRKSGRVVVVHISETGGVGLEPYHNDHLPPYQSSESEKFDSLDLERIGGLKELERGLPPRS